MQASLQGKDNVIKQLKKKNSHLQETRSEADHTLNHYKELYDSIKIKRAKHIEQATALTTKNVNLKAKILNTVNSVSKDHVKPTVLAPGKYAIDVEPILSLLRHNRDAHLDYLRSQPRSNTKKNKISPAKGVMICCSKHMTGDRSRLMNFVKKFIGTVRFGNDHFGAIMGYGDYVIRDSVISMTVPRTPQQNGVVEIRNRTLVEAARIMLIFSKAPMFLWAEVVATAVFGALCYPTNDSDDLGKLQPTADSGIFVGLAPNFLMPGQISSGLVPNPVPATPYAPPTNKELEILYQPMFDEYLEPPRAERPIPPAQAVQAPVNSASTPSSTTIDKDEPSLSILPSSSALQSHSLNQGVAAEPNYMEDHTVAPVDNNPFVNVFAEPHSEASSSGDISSIESPYVSQTLHHLNIARGGYLL
nr:retrovirus-related Pol polyprotein from transposon TNT 1-94 [Tanacetum cinerariifolium]